MTKSKKILLCFDGTLNNAKDFVPDDGENKSLSNVLKIHLLAGGDINNRRNDVPGQISLYERGVGGNLNTKLKYVLAFGGDLERQTKPMRKKLEAVYKEGDQLHIIGFSRGAAAARKFATELFEHGLHTKDGKKIEQPPIDFLGCFETVSMQFKHQAVGTILWNQLKKEAPKSTVLGEDGRIVKTIKMAVHNVALDDNRMFHPFPQVFPPVLMGTEERVHETWFAGEHGDVGGTVYYDGLPDSSCKYMLEWMESIDDGLKFIKAEDIHPDCLKIDGHPKIKILAEDLTIVPNAGGTNAAGSRKAQISYLNDQQKNKPSYRPVYRMLDDKILPDATINIHESVLQFIEKERGEKEEKYTINPKLVEVKERVAVVGSLDKVLGAETKRLVDLLSSE